MKEQIIAIKYNNKIENRSDYREDITNVVREKAVFLLFPRFVNKSFCWLEKVQKTQRKYHLYEWVAYDGWDCNYWAYCGEHWDTLSWKL